MTESESERFVLRNARHLSADYVRRTVRPGDTVSVRVRVAGEVS